MSFNIHEIGRKFGHRAHNRIHIPGAVVSWKISEQESSSDARCPLSDISMGGVAFLTNNPPDVGSRIVLLVWAPRKTEAFELLGEVKYSIARGPRLTYKYRIGVELRPFDQSEGCNTLQALEQFKELEKRYGKRRSKK
jgi:hypothetical protein